MAAFVARYASAFLDVVTAAKLDTAAIGVSSTIFWPHGTAAPSCANFS